MKHKELRKKFRDFFSEQDHPVIEPCNIIPVDDPTLLFINAGMNQFKETLLGREKRSYTRCQSIQPCMRVGGKHNDLDAVGHDGRHLTWFEMMGNWSFGDYYKAEAIEWAWNLATRELGLNKSRLYASIYKDDDEAYELWRKVTDISDANIVRLGDIDKGDEENFWSMGPTGPCGPCTELYFDQGEAFGHDVVGGETDRFLEFWNLVFMQYDRAEDGTLNPLAMKSVDTGMGLERIAALLQGKSNVFHTDLFMPIIEAVQNLCSRDFSGENMGPMCVMADHIRALTFVLRDHGQFDRAGRGYVLRRILRRAVLHASKLGLNEPCLYKLVPTAVETVGAYETSPEVQSRIQGLIKGEEERFLQTLDRGLVFYNKAVEGMGKGATIDGETAFKLYDTYGFPVDLTRILAEENGLKVDENGFEAELEEQKKRSQAAGAFYDAGGWIQVSEGDEAGFAGYGMSEAEVKVRRYREAAEEGYDLILDRTPFYVEGGGEMADFGSLSGDELYLKVTNVAKSDAGVIHHVIVKRGSIDVLNSDATLHAEVNTIRRAAKAAHHTATHLLHAALRDMYGTDTRQKGSLVDDDRLRFDFSLDRKPTPEELEELETTVNQWIVEGHQVLRHQDVPIEEAKKRGALLFFGDRYGDRVRVIDVPGVSMELCGGNHVANTGEIGMFSIVSEAGIAAGIRRIEAVTHMAAVNRFQEMNRTIGQLQGLINAPADRLVERVEGLLGDLDKLRKEKKKLMKQGGGMPTPKSLIDEGQKIGDVITVVKEMDGEPEMLKTMVDNLRSANAGGVYVLYFVNEDKGMLFVGVGQDLIDKKVTRAGDLARNIGKALGSGGGGKPTFAQAGFKGATPDQVAEAAKTELTKALAP